MKYEFNYYGNFKQCDFEFGLAKLAKMNFKEDF